MISVYIYIRAIAVVRAAAVVVEFEFFDLYFPAQELNTVIAITLIAL